MADDGAIEHKAYTRVGLLRNPSDMYYGNTISFSLDNFWAFVRLEPSQGLLISLHPTHDLVQFNSISHLTGLSGSSAIVCVTLSCLLDFYNVRPLIKVEVRSNLILNEEKELGIVAGLQDRVAQVYGGVVYLVHSTIRQRWLDGDKFIISSMEEVAKLAVEGQKKLLEKNYAKLAEFMNRNSDLRRQMFGDECLGALNIEMVEVAGRVGGTSKFTGSGGVVVAFCPDGPSQVKQLQEECQKVVFVIQPIKIMHSLLNDTVLQILQSK